jgi:hypothetical protein
LEFNTPPVGVLGSFVWKVQKKSFSETSNVAKGHDLIGVGGQNVWHQPWNLVQHIIANANYPSIMRFRKPHYPTILPSMTNHVEVHTVTVSQKGSLGMTLDERLGTRGINSKHASRVTDVVKGGQAETIGIKHEDYIIGINTFDVSLATHEAIMKLLVTTTRPFTIAVFRGEIDEYRANPTGQVKEPDRFNVPIVFDEGKLGLQMAEEDKRWCSVQGVNKDSQGKFCLRCCTCAKLLCFSLFFSAHVYELCVFCCFCCLCQALNLVY